MHIYKKTKRSVYAWNAVNVEVDGQLLHGRVIGLEEKPANDSTPPRLVVDFGCPTQEAVLVDDGKIWDCSIRRSTRVNDGDKVEVLLHEGPERPWKWHPGTMVIPEFLMVPDVALVQVMMDGQSRRELLPWIQIRDPLQRDLLPVGHFVIQKCRVPNGYWTLHRDASERLIRQIEEKFRLRFFKVLSQEMHYVCRRQKKPLTDENLVIEFERGKENPLPSSPRKLCEKFEDPDSELRRRKSYRVGESRLPVPLELLKEVFNSLDTVDRQRCRRTCQLWEAMLTSPDVCQELRLPLGTLAHKRRDPVKYDSNYFTYVCICQHITPLTHTICIYGSETNRREPWHMGGAREAMDLITNILGADNNRIDRLIVQLKAITILKPIYLAKLSALSAAISAFMFNLMSCCKRVIWKDCFVTYGADDLFFKTRIPFAGFTHGDVGVVDLVNMIEKEIRCEQAPWDVQLFAQQLAIWIADKESTWDVIEILEDFQSCDPRPSAHYRSQHWTLHNVASVDVGKLNRFCLFALWRYMHGWNPALVDDHNAHDEPSSEASVHKLEE